MKQRFVLVLFLALIFMASHFSTPISHASSASIHGCAPLLPPSVSGSSVPAPAVPAKLLINEVLSFPGSRWNCSEAQNTYSNTNDAWVELYNPQNQAYNLYAAHATFEISSSAKPFYLPLGSVIASHGYLALFISMFSGTPINGNIRLLIGEVTIDQIDIPALKVDQSYARIPDGSNSWQITNTPTIDASNSISQPGPTLSPTMSSSNQGPTGNSGASTTPVLIVNTHTVWSSLQFPTPVSIETPVTRSMVTNTPLLSAPVNHDLDTPHRILITTLVIALALMLFWCWRLFTNP
ncbi:MAG: hypothetical protein ACXWPS_13720 [Ktedonobacteraceae bacterium]